MITTTLSGAVAASDASITVTSNGEFPDASYFIAIDREEMQVTARSGTTWTVSRTQAALASPIFADRFDRIETDTLGTATDPAGHSAIWQGDDVDADHAFDVDGNAFIGVLTAGQNAAARLPFGLPLDCQLRFRFLHDDNLDSIVDARLRRREPGIGDHYRARLTVSGAGAMSLRLAKTVTSVTTNLAGAVTPPGTVVLDEWVWLAIAVSGINPTTVYAKAWRDVDGEPGSWQTTATDSDATLQVEGTSEFRIAPNSGTGLYWLDDYEMSTFPLGITHANGSTVVLIEDWDEPLRVGTGPPSGTPRTGRMWLDIAPSAPILYIRTGAQWHRFDSALSALKWS